MSTETPSEHFGRCGPFCPHIQHCADCREVFWVCAAHRSDPDKSFTWKPNAPVKPTENIR